MSPSKTNKPNVTLNSTISTNLGNLASSQNIYMQTMTYN